MKINKEESKRILDSSELTKRMNHISNYGNINRDLMQSLHYKAKCLIAGYDINKRDKMLDELRRDINDMLDDSFDYDVMYSFQKIAASIGVEIKEYRDETEDNNIVTLIYDSKEDSYTLNKYEINKSNQFTLNKIGSIIIKKDPRLDEYDGIDITDKPNVYDYHDPMYVFIQVTDEKNKSFDELLEIKKDLIWCARYYWYKYKDLLEEMIKSKLDKGLEGLEEE